MEKDPSETERAVKELTELVAHQPGAAPSRRCACADSSAPQQPQPSVPPQTTCLCPSGTAHTPDGDDRGTHRVRRAAAKHAPRAAQVALLTSLDSMIPNKGKRTTGSRAVTASGSTSVHQYTAIRAIT